jgi:hypothetical protein
MDGLKICGWPYLISCDEKYLPNQHITLREREREREPHSNKNNHLKEALAELVAYQAVAASAAAAMVQ